MILALIDHDRGKLDETYLEMLTAGRSLAAALDQKLEAVVIGGGGRSLSPELGKFGVQRVHLAVQDLLDDYAPQAWAACAVHLIGELQPQAVLAPGTDRGSEVMAHIGAQTGLAMAANCFEITPGDSAYEVTRVRWGGSLFEQARLSGQVKLMTIAPHMIGARPADQPLDCEVSEFSPPLVETDFRVKVASRTPAEGGVSLTDARVVVGGGRGVGSSEGFAVLEDLAQLLGGAVGCSRVVTNNGWRPHADQIGQTGARVAPDLYIACGISGAIQHWVGCAGSKKILVINTDPEAPIIARADYAVIGDLHEIIPAICEEVRKLQAP